MKYQIVIWGADNYNALGLLRQLADDRFDVIFANTGSKNSCASVSKYCTRYCIRPVDSEAVSGLLCLKEENVERAILIPTGDATAEYIDKHRLELLPYFHLMGTRQSGLLSKIDDKSVMNQLAIKHGFDVPEKSIFRKYDAIPTTIPFPAILKPIFSQNGIVRK